MTHRHSVIATTLFSASVLGSLYYTVKFRRSAFTDAKAWIMRSGEIPHRGGVEQDEVESLAPVKATYSYQLKFR
jgi:hypothetical protein